MKQYKKQVVKFSLLQWFFWSSWATFGAYIVYYLGDMGYSNIEIGIIISIRTFTGLLGEPLLSYISDVNNTNKKVFMASMVLLALVVLPFPYYDWRFMLFSMGIIGFLWAPQQSVLDSWIMKRSKRLADNYGFMRAWGSLGYALVVILFGKAIEVYGWGILFISYSTLIFIAVIMATLISDVPQTEEDTNSTSSDEQIESKNPLALFKNLEYTMIVISSMLNFIPISVVFVFLPNFIKGVGGTPVLLGYTYFLSALSEAPILFFAKTLLKRFKPVPLLLISAIFYALRVWIIFKATLPGHFLFFGVLHSLSFGLFLTTIRYHINMIAPENLKTTAQSIVTMSSFGIGGIIASLFGGYVMDVYGLTVLFKLCMLINILAIILLITIIFYKRVWDV